MTASLLKVFNERIRIPRPHSLEDYLVSYCSWRFLPGAQVMQEPQFNSSSLGEVEGDCHIVVDNGTIQTCVGKASQPNVIVRAPFDLWIDMVSGKANAIQMFMAGEVQFRGRSILPYEDEPVVRPVALKIRGGLIDSLFSEPIFRAFFEAFLLPGPPPAPFSFAALPRSRR